jgi:hypothetical protein
MNEMKSGANKFTGKVEKQFWALYYGFKISVQFMT